MVLAGPVGDHAELARRFVERGQSVVSTADAIADVRGLLDLDTEARERGVTVVVGRRLRPRSDLRAGRPGRAALRRGRRDPRGQGRHRRSGLRPPAPPGPRRHGRSTGATAAGSSGRRAAVASCAGSRIRSGPRTATAPRCPTRSLLVPAFPGVARVTARLAATRRDRLTARLPDAAAAPSRGRSRCGPGRGARPSRRQSGRDRARRHGSAGGRGRARSPPWARSGPARAACAGTGAGGLAELVEPLPLPGRAAPARGAGGGLPARCGWRVRLIRGRVDADLTLRHPTAYPQVCAYWPQSVGRMAHVGLTRRSRWSERVSRSVGV